MNIQELDSYNLADTVKFHSRLNPRLWDSSEHLLPEVKAKLMQVAQDFQEFLGVPDLDVKDITISGSNAAFNYTPTSDIDLHLVIDIPNVTHDEVYRELFNAKKYQYNDEHDIRIRGADVELYAQDSAQPHHSQGIYSLLNDAWVSVPKRTRAEIDDVSTRSKFEDLAARIDDVIKSQDVGRMDSLMKKIKTMRQTGLEKQGEFGSDNLAFKLLRNNEYIKRLIDAKQAARDHELSLAELAQHKQKVRYGFGESPDGVDPTTKMFLEEPATESPDGVNPTTAMFLTEVNTESVVQEFIQHTADRLGIQHLPKIIIHHDQDWSESNHSFGMYVPDRHELHVSLGDRHLLDILRTTAHELCHCAQHESEPLPDHAGDTGSAWENEANAVAGIVMRDFANSHPEYFQHDAIKESASGYIPTKAQARDPRYSMALTVDIKPGQVGREANKLNLKTDRQGRPALLMKTANLQESLAREFAVFESQDLFEINMGSKNLRKEAAKTGAIAGMEFEMIVPNVEGGDDDGQLEADYSFDEGITSIQEAYDFFYDGDYNSRGDVTRLRDRMQNEYYEWLSNEFDSRWDSDEFEFVYNYLKENASTEEIAEILGIELDADNYPDTVERQTYLDAADKVVEASYGNYWYDQARESAQEDFNQNADLESEWLESRDLNTMQDIENEYNMSWPHWEQQGGGEASIEDVANEFQDAIGRDVRASGNYHSGSVRRPSPTAQHYIVEPDGSLEADDSDDVGLEFVSPPLPIDDILSDLNKVKQWAKVYGCYTNDSTGLHINISVPNYSRENLDFVKLALLMGDEYVLDLFGRAGNTYAKPAIKMVRDQVRQNPDEAERLLDKMKGNLDSLASKAIHSGVTSKYTSINTKDGHIEFRSPGGDWLDENFDKIENTLLRFTVAMSAALNPEMYREEYLKKLYKLLTQDQKDSDTIKYFSEYVAGKIPAAALRSFVKQAQLERKVKRGETSNQKMWWSVTNPRQSSAGIEVVATSKEEAIAQALGPDGYPSWANTRQSIVAKPLRPFEDTSLDKPFVWKVQGTDSPYQRQGIEVVAFSALEAMQKARRRWNLNTGGTPEQEFFRLNGWIATPVREAPATADHTATDTGGNWGIWINALDRFANEPGSYSPGQTPTSMRFPSQAAAEQWIEQQRAERPNLRNDIEVREIEPAEQTTKYEIYNKQTGNAIEDADGITNDAEALVRLNDYIEHGPHTLNRDQATAMFGIRTVGGVGIVDIDIPMAPGRAATSPTGQWKIIDGLGREVYRFRPAVNTRAKANELAALWARENNFDGNYQVEPAEDTVQTGTQDQQQGGLIDVAGSTTDPAQQRATPGTFTGAWRVVIASTGEEVYRFSGVGNNQADANSVAAQWQRRSRLDDPIEVYPIMS